MAQLYHWPVPCIICESPVEYHCNTCGDVLCSKCRENHLKSNAGRNHDVVPYSQRIEPNKATLQCGDHPGHQCGVWCQTCNKAVCNECLISPSHRGHIFLKFDEKIGERRKEIQDQFEKYSKLLSEWQSSLQQGEKLKNTYEKDIYQLDREIVSRADEICMQVRAVEQACRKQLQEMKDASLIVFQNQEKYLSDGIQNMKKKIKDIEDTLRSNDTPTILQCPIEEEEIAGTKPSMDDSPVAPVFTHGSLNNEIIQNMFGNLSEEVLVPNTQSSQQKSSLLTMPSVESIINQDQYSAAVACIGSGQAWIRTDNKRIQLVDRQGKVKRTVNLKFYPKCLALTPQGNILLPEFQTNCIKSVSITRDPDVWDLFSTNLAPCGICCLPNGDIVVTFTKDKRVVQYSCTGKVIREMDRSLFQYPFSLAHSQVNQQFYICGKSSNALCAVGRLLILSMKGTLQYTYTGTDAKTFTPAAVCADLAGHVLITEWSKGKVHILDKGGNFLQYILTREELTGPVGIDVDSEGYAWISEWNTMKVVKYMERN